MTCPVCSNRHASALHCVSCGWKSPAVVPVKPVTAAHKESILAALDGDPALHEEIVKKWHATAEERGPAVMKWPVVGAAGTDLGVGHALRPGFSPHLPPDFTPEPHQHVAGMPLPPAIASTGTTVGVLTWPTLAPPAAV